MVQIGVDFGGTKIEAAALDRHGEFLLRRRMPNPGDYAESIDVVRQLIAGIENELGRTGTIGVGVPGSVSQRTRKMRNANATWLNGKPFPQDLMTALDRDIRLANDANCLALSEINGGAMKGAKIGFAIVLGTGCGGGLAVNGKVIEGANGICGEWGHVPLPWGRDEDQDRRGCWCGKENCLETWISGPALSRDYWKATGDTLTAREIVELSRSGNTVAQSVKQRFIDRLARAIAVVSNLIDPDVFVIGGGLSNISEIYDSAPTLVSDYVFADKWQARISPARWGDSSGVRGAAQLWPFGVAQEPVMKNVTEVHR